MRVKVSLLLPMGTVLVCGLGLANTASAHEPAHLHFSHPLIAESPSPDTKLRGDYLFQNLAGENAAESHTLNLEGEYAFAPWISVEADLPYTFSRPDAGGNEQAVDNAEVAVKFANFSFAEQGLLLGGGLELGLPTGDDSEGIGSNNVLEFEPFLDFGYRRAGLEVVGVYAVGLPTNENGEDEADAEHAWNLSFLYRLTPRVSTLLEFDGVEVNGGEEDGVSIANISPGIKIAPFADRNLEIGAGISFPLTSDREFNTRAIFSVFKHY